MAISSERIVEKLGFDGHTSSEYTAYVQSVKRQFLRRDHPKLLQGPQNLEAETGSLLLWEQGLDDLYAKYPTNWDLARFAGPGERRKYAHTFLVGQAKKARAEQAAEERKAKEEAKRREQAEKRALTQRARGRKHGRHESGSSPVPRLPSRSSVAYSPSPKRRRVLVNERPELEFNEFAIFLKSRPGLPATSYSRVWDFDELLLWIIQKSPPLAGQRIVCWMNITIQSEQYAEITGLEVGQSCKRLVSDQSSWIAAVLMHQANHRRGEPYHGFPIWAALADDKEAPEHEEGDVIAPKADQEEGGPEGDVIAPEEKDGGPGPAREGNSAEERGKGSGVVAVAGGVEEEGDGQEGDSSDLLVEDPSKEPKTDL